MGSRYKAVNQYNQSESKWNRELKSLKKKNQIIYRITKKSGSHHEIKKIKKIRDKASRKRRDDSINYSIKKSDSDYSLSSDSDWDEHRRPAGRKDINSLDHVVTGNIKTNKYQHNDAI